MTTSPNALELLQLRLNYQFRELTLLEQALTHKSFCNARRADPILNNEKLEFLGDAVLGLALSRTLMQHFEAGDEGQLSRLRASLVNEETLCQLASEIELPLVLRLGKGEVATGGAQKPRLLASALEAILGAIFLESGYDAAQCVVDHLFQSRLQNDNLSTADYTKDYKTRLQELTQAYFQIVPNYQLIKAEGPEHQKTFEVELMIGEKFQSRGEGRSKKQAEQAAARHAIETLTTLLSEIQSSKSEPTDTVVEGIPETVVEVTRESELPVYRMSDTNIEEEL